MDKCQVCNQCDAVGYGAMPGVPMSFAYCQTCLEHDAHPYWVVVANTACIGGYDQATDWWKDLVDHTLQRLNKPMEKFLEDVKHDLEAERVYWDSIDNT